MKLKTLRHLPLFEAFSPDQDEEDIISVDSLPYFQLISNLEIQLQEQDSTPQVNCWQELERALSTCAYLGADRAAKSLISLSLWGKRKFQLEPILDFETSTWKNDRIYTFLENYLKLHFKINTDKTGKIDASTRVQHCWTDIKIHDIYITTTDAAYHGNLKTLRHLREQGAPWNRYTCANAAQGGHLDFLTYLHENECPWDANTCAGAAANGHLACLTYAHESGCPWDASTISLAHINDRWACLNYAISNRCPFPDFIDSSFGSCMC